MKRLEQLAHLQKLSLPDLKQEITDIEKKVQAAQLAIAFGKSKKVRDVRNLRKDLARALTIGNQKVSQAGQSEK